MKRNGIGGKIRYYRQKLNMTQQQLADKINTTWEMVSRYEREKSSPFNRINEISEALKVSPSQLLQEDNNASSIRYYEVPLFTHIPDNYDFSEKNTPYYYSAPKWIAELGFYVYALEARLAKNNTLDLRNNGIVYISQDDPQNTNIFLVNNNGELTFSDSKNSAIGFILAQELRFTQ